MRLFRVSILENFFWNFTSRSRVISISLSLLDLDFQSFRFHFHFSKRVKGEKISPFFSKKRVKFDTKFHKKINHSRRVQNPKQSTSGIIFKFTSQSRSQSFFTSLSLLDFDFQSFLLFHFHSSISISSKKNSLALLEESKWHFFSLHLSLLYCPKPTLTGHWTLVMLEQYVLQHHGICKKSLNFPRIRRLTYFLLHLTEVFVAAAADEK